MSTGRSPMTFLFRLVVNVKLSSEQTLWGYLDLCPLCDGSSKHATSANSVLPAPPCLLQLCLGLVQLPQTPTTFCGIGIGIKLSSLWISFPLSPCGFGHRNFSTMPPMPPKPLYSAAAFVASQAGLSLLVVATAYTLFTP
jgi:hypothetical protein